MDLIGLFALSFGAATLLPLSSEALLAAMAHNQPDHAMVFLVVASVGNVLGAVVNWALGMWLLRWRQARWFPFSEKDLARAQARFNQWGLGGLLLAWVPIIGDPLTFAAGVLRVPFLVFLTLVALAKTARYLVVLSLV